MSGPGQGESKACSKGFSQKWEVERKAGNGPGRGDSGRKLMGASSGGCAWHSEKTRPLQR